MTGKAVFDAVERFGFWLDRLTGWICVVLGAFMTAVVFVAVIFRYVFNAPLEWSEELSTFMMVWFAMLGAAMGIRRGRHVGVSYVVEKLGFLNRHSRWIQMLNNLMMSAFLVLLLRQGYALALFAHAQRSPALMIPMSWPYFGLLVGSAACICQLAVQIALAAAGRQTLVEDACCYMDE
ncbi:TRAP-type C4-dicarboxylate transport system, small permease component [Desulfacinum infernum DSM 9756]|uniref:TRAP-type C4-dicarboxylate transport system, small permease component n=1 Tax=Desulfacinum infernum DSM 9756 TaxID=1121391 RepID=A0A1M5BQN5_9BACT|nr:TRAP transporter small permease [Desulfacinum infernum]SHF44868.1 TRAP-type C4-dicarboxylate transport system, small permease component [Desulfacinum infernum DSM 9756]